MKLHPTHTLMLLATVLISIFSALPAPATEPPPLSYDATIVEVITTCQEFDPQIPWRKKQPQIRQGLGVVIEGGQVLTVEGIVRNATLLEIRRVKSGAKLEAKVIEADDQIGAALLKVSAQNAGEQFKGVPITDKVRRNDMVTIVKIDESGQFQRDEGQVVEIMATPHGLLLKVLTDLGLEKNGTPVFLGGRLAGITINYDKNTQTCLVLSGTTLQKFCSSVNSPPYSGIAWAGIRWEPLLDPAKRKYLAIGETTGGILVTRTTAGSGAAAVLQAEDVILEWDGCQIDELGYYQDPDFGRLLLTHLINGRRAPGETAAVTILRNKQKSVVQIPLNRQNDSEQIIPENTTGLQAEYLAEGGLILRELTGDYLRSGGNEWIIQTNPRLVYYYFNPWQFSDKPGEHIVILSKVLPDQINIGYHDYRNEIVTAVNGRPVRKLADVFAAVDRDNGLKNVSLMGYDVDLVLAEEELAAANQRIAVNYRIPSLRFQRAQPAQK